MVTPSNGFEIKDNITLSPGTYHLPAGMRITSSGVTLDGNGAQLVGNGDSPVGIQLADVHGVTIRNLRLSSYRHGILADECADLTFEANQIRQTAEVPPNTDFLDIWKPPEATYGSGILLRNVDDSLISQNDLQHQMCGLLNYYCRGLRVESNISNYCSGFGFHLYETSDCHFEGNYADFCCRFQPREGSVGHMGADSAGFVIVHNSSRNMFKRNFARLSGDGFFLAGLTADLEPAPCNENQFVENDASYSPNIGFEATFSSGNRFIGNRAHGCNYGFWLGFSRENTLEDNIIQKSRFAGVACENGQTMKVVENEFAGNQYGLLLWSKHIPEFGNQNPTSSNWAIHANRFHDNTYGVRIAANQDHGTYPHPSSAKDMPLPKHHTLKQNRFTDNQIGIELENVEGTILENNRFEGSVVGDVLGEPATD
jgi:parallel beta-helix repeat protein